ncbi:MAG: hypothetical protein IKD35_01985 [Clostridia bacterium]|nr:hypothetical protein [Clostridia bacterium]
MEKRDFNRITKELLLKYGFKKDKNCWALYLDKVTIYVKLRSWRDVKSFNYWFCIEELRGVKYGTCIVLDSDALFETKMEHSPDAQGYHKHEILYENYSKEEYHEMFDGMLHKYIDPFKEDAFKHIATLPIGLLHPRAIEFLKTKQFN